MPHDWFAPYQIDGDNVAAAGEAVAAVFGEPHEGGAADLAELAGGKRGFGSAVGRAGAEAYFNEDDGAGDLGDDVDLTEVFVVIVAFKDAIASFFQVVLGEFFGKGADLCSIHGDNSDWSDEGVFQMFVP
jgi:hypothetical protein